MITEKNFKDIITAVLIVGLFILAVLIIRPVILSIIFGFLLAYIFYPIYKWSLKKIKNENLSALLMCILLLLIILIPIILILSSLVSQAVNVYLALQNTDLAGSFRESLPTFIASSEISEGLANSLDALIPKIISYFISKFSGFVLNIPIIMLQVFVVIFVFFFGLRDGKKGVAYVRSLSPFKKEIAEKFFIQFKDITNSVLLGQIVIGILQGITAGIGYFIFGVPYALFFTLLTMLVGIIPLIGPWLVWVPIDIYLFLSGRVGVGFGLLIYGLIVISWLDTIIRPLIVSRRTEINSAIVIVGMIGGLFVFGVLGLIIGPLILGYVLLVIELYRERKSGESLFFKKVEEPAINIREVINSKKSRKRDLARDSTQKKLLELN